jgi:hypothetical protein
MIKVKGKLSKIGPYTLIFGAALGLFLGGSIASAFSGDNLHLRVLIQGLFFLCGGIIGYSLDKSDQSKSESDET